MATGSVLGRNPLGPPLEGPLLSIDLVYLILGVALLLAAVLPGALERYAVSAAMVLLVVGMGVGLLPMPQGLSLDPLAIRPQIDRITELTVLVALMGVGLAIDRPLRIVDRSTWWPWSPTWRLLAIGMPLTIGAVALLGWGLGLAPAAALLLGAALSPTDPVLAGDVQVGGPSSGATSLLADDKDDSADDMEDPSREPDVEEHDDEDDDVRFALTSEAGLNDGLAFPFVAAALLLASGAAASGWSWGTWAGWFAWDLVGRVGIGVAVGVALGWVLGQVAFRAPRPSLRLAEQGEPLLAIAALVMAYGLAQVAHGYGFLAVFACGFTLRASERGHEYHRSMHDVIQRLERLLTLIVLLLLGMAITNGLLGSLDWRGIVVAVALVFHIRPVAGVISLRARARPYDERGGLGRKEALATAFFGVRGVGSLYYLAYAAGEHAFPEERWLWSTVAFSILLSVVVHGVLSTPVMAYLERRRARV
ncbi:MAG: sodium/proton antiporter, family [Humibacillus sp.]|nr:sodium/proton antiporter, family [Humibacillus sp.]